MDCIHVFLLTLRLSHRFVTANHRQLSLPFSAWKSLEKVVMYKAASVKAVNRLASDWSWSHLNIGPALWLEVGPLWKTGRILQYKILPGFYFRMKQMCNNKLTKQIILYDQHISQTNLDLYTWSNEITQILICNNLFFAVNSVAPKLAVKMIHDSLLTKIVQIFKDNVQKYPNFVHIIM